MELLSHLRQGKGPRLPERSIAGTEKDFRGIRLRIRDSEIKVAIVRKVADRDGDDRPHGGDSPERSARLPFPSPGNSRRVPSPSPTITSRLPSPLKSPTTRARGSLPIRLARSHAQECAIGSAQKNGERVKARVFCIRWCCFHHVRNAISVKVTHCKSSGCVGDLRRGRRRSGPLAESRWQSRRRRTLR